jgi:hypothetical protein
MQIMYIVQSYYVSEAFEFTIQKNLLFLNRKKMMVARY